MEKLPKKRVSKTKSQKLIHSLTTQKNRVFLKKISANEMLLELEKGAFKKNEAYFISDEEDKNYVLVPDNVISLLAENARKAFEARLRAELERDIITQAPIDFEDVREVSLQLLENLRQKDGNLPNINTLNFVKQIKKEHPNLFFNFDNMFKQPPFNENNFENFDNSDEENF
ncbi:DUF2603 domain-containing protein [Helicobacter pylori]|uniref:DUF2603 domain-containing protein n=1 Tax=Helicobacter pylori TaxID=210 RepID=UPI000FDDDE78|nr:DUF2603 domain-containing protein [Helicobacter pylori]RVZ36479.1 DUF2603 domain-containing protein [Helicobacter pylori]RVZ76367.1 DUF2603 domain-containing protein [Helicobacter pylori]